MPENETLVPDSRNASRWRPIRDRMDCGQTPVQAFPDIQSQFYACLQRVWRQWKGNGVDPGQLLAAALDDHPLLRQGWQQCGHCPACVYRRQALITAGISEPGDAYAVDLFAPPDPRRPITGKQLCSIRAFHQQIARLPELDSGRAPQRLRRYLRATHAISSDEQLVPHVEVHRRYRREWLALIADASRRGLPWVAPTRSPAIAQGATP